MKMSMASTTHFLLLVLSICLLRTSTFAEEKSYIVYLGTHTHGLNPTDADAEIATQSHYELLGSVLGSFEKAQESVEYNYNKYINGFAAKLTDDEAERLKSSPDVVSVLENRRFELHTTRTWEFLGLEQNNVVPSNSLWNMSGHGDGVIIGNLDTGVWPESESFSDKNLGLGPIPSKWKGACMSGSDKSFKCNNKLIGARYFRKGFSNLSPRDTEGHGSHTLSTAGGSFVNGANIFGFGKGVAKGGAPKARVAAYKVCWPKGPEGGCMTSDILAAFEAAIDDGVDVLSLSLGGESADYKKDGIAIGSFHAVRHGITVVASAGNSGPRYSTVSNVSPWIFTIGASTIDRAFTNRVILSNSTLHLKGATVGPDRLMPRRKFHPLIDGAAAYANFSSADDSRYCLEGSLEPSKVKGKIVICLRGGSERVPKGEVVKSAGGVGMIILNSLGSGNVIEADPHVLPATHLSYKDGITLLEYISNTTNPTAYITSGKTQTGIQRSPVMAPFSSRGPSLLYPQILKPDVTAPGVGVLAAYTGEVGPSGFKFDKRRVGYNVMSGTSMSCPHVSGIVGLIKALHPDWSPAAIRSAIMTTATTLDLEKKPIMDSNGEPATPFGYGAGHINPNAAANPGLIYNLTETDYLDYLCSIYTKNDLKVFTPISYNCQNKQNTLDFNYPSITVSNFTKKATLKRTVTNVGNPGTYEVKVSPPSGVSVKVVPCKLTFKSVGEEQIFSVKLKATKEKPSDVDYVFGSLEWDDGTHNVRSPIVVERIFFFF